MARKIAVEIVGDSRSLERAFSRSSKSAKDFNRSVSRTSRTTRAFGGLTRSVGFLSSAFIGTAGLATAAHAAFSEMADAQKVSAQTRAALKSTGGVANVTAKHVDTLANSLLNLSGTDDEVIKSGENMLLTFTRIRNQVGKNNDIFDQATKAALDMSTAMGQDMKQSALQLGKALNDPIKGVTALRRVGVQFSDDQVKLIKRLVETGHTLEAQKIILREVNREFGGSAKAAGGTLPGKLNILKQTVLNLGGAIAKILTPSIEKLVNRLVKWLQNSRNQKQVLDTVKQAAAAVRDVVNALAGAFGFLNKITGSTKHTLELLFGVFVAIKGLQMASAFANIGRSLGLIGTNAGKAAGKTGALRTALLGLGRMGPIAIPIALFATAFVVQPYVTRALNSLFTKVGLRHQPSPASKDRPVFKGGRLVWSGSGAPYVHGQPRDPRGPSRMAAAGAGAAGGAVYTGDIHVHGVQNVHQFEREMQRRKRRGAVSRSGPRAGQRGD